MIALNPLVPSWFTLPEDEGSDSPTEFHLKPLSGADTMEIMPHTELFDDGNSIKITPDGLRMLIKKGLINWKNVRDSEGNDLPFNQDNIERLSLFAFKDIGTEIFNRTQIMPEDKKKS